MHSLHRPAAAGGVGRRGAATGAQPTTPSPLPLSRPARAPPGRSSGVVPRAGLLEAVLKPITTAGQIKDLKTGIAAFYDESSGLWEDVWGSEHMHHGYYPPAGEAGPAPASDTDAQVEMVDRVLEWAGVAPRPAVGGGGGGASAEEATTTTTAATASAASFPPPPRTMVDIGCGVGGSSRHVARRFPGATTEGLTLSPVQAARAAKLSEREPALARRCRFRVADALDAPFPDGSFDLVWSLESGEHMPGKARFVRELARLCAPGGRVIVVTWCHRDLAPGEASLRPEEQALLDRICEAYYLPPWCPPSEYAALMRREGLRDVRQADWSDAVAPFWGAVIRRALTPRGVAGLLGAGWQTIKGALVMPMMARGLAMGTIRFALITAVKPPAAAAAAGAASAAA